MGWAKSDPRPGEGAWSRTRIRIPLCPLAPPAPPTCTPSTHSFVFFVHSARVTRRGGKRVRGGRVRGSPTSACWDSTRSFLHAETRRIDVTRRRLCVCERGGPWGGRCEGGTRRATKGGEAKEDVRSGGARDGTPGARQSPGTGWASRDARLAGSSRRARGAVPSARAWGAVARARRARLALDQPRPPRAGNAQGGARRGLAARDRSEGSRGRRWAEKRSRRRSPKSVPGLEEVQRRPAVWRTACTVRRIGGGSASPGHPAGRRPPPLACPPSRRLLYCLAAA